MKTAKIVFVSVVALLMTGCATTVTTIKDKIHQWTAPTEVTAPTVEGRGAGGGGAMRR